MKEESAYRQHDRHYVAVDCIIFAFDGQKLRLLAVKRGFEPGKGQWSLVGGFLRENESLDEAANRILFELTGLSGIYLEQLYTYGEIKRDIAARVISVAYYALVGSMQLNSVSLNNQPANWFSLDELPEMVFDHNEMTDRALKRLRRKCRSMPVGFELLPARFTLPGLLQLYEAIFLQEFDKRNFRKKILSLGVLEKLDEKDMEGSRKGAFLYRFNKEVYDNMLRNGFSFEI